jgi:hypothetical protein
MPPLAPWLLLHKEREMAESKKMMQKEIDFMRKKGAPKAMIRHEMAEKNGKVKNFAAGGMVTRGNGAATKGTKARGSSC